MLGTFASEIWNPIYCATWKKHPTYIHWASHVARRCCWRMSLCLAAADPKVGVKIGTICSWQVPKNSIRPHTDIGRRRTKINETKLILNGCFFGVCEPLVLSFSGCCMLCCFYFAATSKRSASRRRSTSPHPPLKNIWGNSCMFLSFWDGF